eukprot:gene32164-40689_t
MPKKASLESTNGSQEYLEVKYFYTDKAQREKGAEPMLVAEMICQLHDPDVLRLSDDKYCTFHGNRLDAMKDVVGTTSHFKEPPPDVADVENLHLSPAGVRAIIEQNVVMDVAICHRGDPLMVQGNAFFGKLGFLVRTYRQGESLVVHRRFSILQTQKGFSMRMKISELQPVAQLPTSNMAEAVMRDGEVENKHVELRTLDMSFFRFAKCPPGSHVTENGDPIAEDDISIETWGHQMRLAAQRIENLVDYDQGVKEINRIVRDESELGPMTGVWQ